MSDAMDKRPSWALSLSPAPRYRLPSWHHQFSDAAHQSWQLEPMLPVELPQDESLQDGLSFWRHSPDRILHRPCYFVFLTWVSKSGLVHLIGEVWGICCTPASKDTGKVRIWHFQLLLVPISHSFRFLVRKRFSWFCESRVSEDQGKELRSGEYPLKPVYWNKCLR